MLLVWCLQGSEKMKKESLEEARTILIERVLQSNIKSQDKTELIILLHCLLQPEKYKENVKILRR